MSVRTQLSARPALRWVAPFAVLAAAAGGAALAGSATASDDVPPRSAHQLLADVAAAGSVPLSGTVATTADLGLPDVSGLTGSSGSPGGSSAASPSSLASGDHQLRVWSDGPTRLRVVQTSSLGESDVVRSGQDVWTWSSASRTAVHTVLPAASAHDGPSPAPSASASLSAPTSASLTPDQLATRALAAADGSSEVSVASAPVSVAGRTAYELVVTPRTSATRVGSVRIAIDATHHVPLRVQVLARGASSPALSAAFTSVDFSSPAASLFAFTPPTGATVRQQAVPQPGTRDPAERSSGARVVGTGWSSVVVAPLKGATAGAAGSGGDGAQGAQQVQRALASLPQVSGSWGHGRLLTSALGSVLVTDDGRVLAGAVDPSALYAAAGSAQEHPMGSVSPGASAG